MAINRGVTFYSPAARRLATNRWLCNQCRPAAEPDLISGRSIVYPETPERPNAIYVVEPGTAKLEPGWFWKWLTG